MPGRFTEICPATGLTKRWKTFWKELHKLEWLRRKDLTALHLFHFGSYVPMFDLAGNTRLMKCHLCSFSVPKNGILSHTYNSCESSKFWWQEIGFAQPMNLNEMLAPADTSYENLRKLNWFVKTVKRVYSRRRREALEGSDPVPLLPRELKKALGETFPLGRWRIIHSCYRYMLARALLPWFRREVSEACQSVCTWELFKEVFL